MNDTCEQESLARVLREPEQARRATILTKIETHKANPANEIIEVVTLDEKGAGGAHHEYLIYWPNGRASVQTRQISFQNGPIKERGVNGLTQEVLLAVVQHRLECFQSGDFACPENEAALLNVKAALKALKDRTMARQERGVEGTNEK